MYLICIIIKHVENLFEFNLNILISKNQIIESRYFSLGLQSFPILIDPPYSCDVPSKATNIKLQLTGLA